MSSVSLSCARSLSLNLGYPPLEQPPKGEDYVDENGIRITVEYTINDEGKKVKVRKTFPQVSLRSTHRFGLQITKKTKRTLQKAVVDHSVAERKTWSKFGQEKGNKPGPDRATTTVGENVVLKLSAGNKVRQTKFASLILIPDVLLYPAVVRT